MEKNWFREEWDHLMITHGLSAWTCTNSSVRLPDGTSPHTAEGHQLPVFEGECPATEIQHSLFRSDVIVKNYVDDNELDNPLFYHDHEVSNAWLSESKSGVDDEIMSNDQPANHRLFSGITSHVLKFEETPESDQCENSGPDDDMEITPWEDGMKIFAYRSVIPESSITNSSLMNALNAGYNNQSGRSQLKQEFSAISKSDVSMTFAICTGDCNSGSSCTFCYPARNGEPPKKRWVRYEGYHL